MDFPKNTPEWLIEAEISANAKFKIKDYWWGTGIVWIEGSFRGEWRDGVWRDGVWRGGEWRGGDQTSRSKYIPLLKSEGSIKIGCKIMSVPEWDEWFKGKEEFETKRGTLE
jgi:hypothetical protein